jgi:hypothetical protein
MKHIGGRLNSPFLGTRLTASFVSEHASPRSLSRKTGLVAEFFVSEAAHRVLCRGKTATRREPLDKERACCPLHQSILFHRTDSRSPEREGINRGRKIRLLRLPAVHCEHEQRLPTYRRCKNYHMRVGSERSLFLFHHFSHATYGDHGEVQTVRFLSAVRAMAHVASSPLPFAQACPRSERSRSRPTSMSLLIDGARTTICAWM